MLWGIFPITFYCPCSLSTDKDWDQSSASHWLKSLNPGANKTSDYQILVIVREKPHTLHQAPSLLIHVKHIPSAQLFKNHSLTLQVHVIKTCYFSMKFAIIFLFTISLWSVNYYTITNSHGWVAVLLGALLPATGIFSFSYSWGQSVDSEWSWKEVFWGLTCPERQ
jgi:hypothetical protein